MKRILIVGAIATALFALTMLFMHIQTLSQKINLLEAQVAQAERAAAAFNRSFCSTGAAEVRDGVTIRHTIQVGDTARTYQVHTPPSYDPSIRYPVVVNFDGIEGSGERMEAYSGMDNLPVIAVYPDSVDGPLGFSAWQGAPYSREGEYDTTFIEAMLDELPSNYCVDNGRIFATGMSNGGGFAMLAACGLPDRIRAVATVSGAFYKSCKASGRQPSVLALHSSTDRQVPLVGSKERKLPKITDWAQREARYRDCKEANNSVEQNGSRVYDWTNCQDESTVRLIVLQNQNHGWLYLPDSVQNRTPSTAQYVWDFFKNSV